MNNEVRIKVEGNVITETDWLMIENEIRKKRFVIYKLVKIIKF